MVALLSHPELYARAGRRHRPECAHHATSTCRSPAGLPDTTASVAAECALDGSRHAAWAAPTCNIL